MSDFLENKSDLKSLVESKSIKENKIIRLDSKWPNDMDSSNGKEFLRMLTDPKLREYRDMILGIIFQPQIEQIFADANQRFLGKDSKGIGFRGILTSTNGPIKFMDLNIKDLKSVVNDGTETDSDKLNISPQKEAVNAGFLDHHRVTQYSTDWVPEIINSDDEIAKDLTPAILVYDLGELISKGGYSAEFKDPKNKSKALLAAYPIDISPILKAQGKI